MLFGPRPRGYAQRAQKCRAIYLAPYLRSGGSSALKPQCAMRVHVEALRGIRRTVELPDGATVRDARPVLAAALGFPAEGAPSCRATQLLAWMAQWKAGGTAGARILVPHRY